MVVFATRSARLPSAPARVPVSPNTKVDPSSNVPVVVSVSVWDTDKDAQEFEEVFEQYLERMVPDHTIDRKGDMVMFATGIPADVDTSKLASAVFKGAKITRPDRKSKRRQRRKERG